MYSHYISNVFPVANHAGLDDHADLSDDDSLATAHASTANYAAASTAYTSVAQQSGGIVQKTWRYVKRAVRTIYGMYPWGGSVRNRTKNRACILGSVLTTFSIRVFF